jgi:hypothetical protein
LLLRYRALQQSDCHQSAGSGAALTRLLDEALEQTFPSNDPIALQQVSIIGRESKAVPAGKHADKKTDRHKIASGGRS